MRFPFLLVVFFAIIGCTSDDNPKAPPGVIIKGRVVKGGQAIHVPRPDIKYGLVEVAFIAEGSPPDSSGESAVVETDGNFQLVGIGKGLAAGKYKVTVRQMINGKDTFGEAFSQEATPIVVEIPAGKVGGEIKLDEIDLDKYLKK